MLIGHSTIIASLKKLADTGNLSHAYLFHGPSMVGKRLVAESLAGYLENKEFVSHQRSLNPVNLIGLDGLLIAPDEQGKIGIDAVRELRGFLSKKPIKSIRRTAIIDGAERMTAEAQNALLRVAEEPPASSLLILTASDIEAIFGTLLSRLAKIYFPTVPVSEISKWLEKETGLKKGEAEKLARGSSGKPGLAYALKNNKEFIERLRSAEKFFSQKNGSRREFIKKLTEPDDFGLNDFLDALIFYLAARPERKIAVWHKLLKLRHRSANFALNPRLQLANLISS